MIPREPLLPAALVLLVLAVGVLASVAGAADAPAKVFRAGAALVDITPTKFPVRVNGGFRERLADKVHDPLHVRALALDDGNVRIAFAVVDSCVIPRALMDKAKALAAKATGLPVERMLISATHTHSAPAVAAVLGTRVQEDYAAWLPGKIAEAIAAACKNLQPARVGWAVGRDETNVFCRRFLMKPGTARTSRFTGKTGDQAQMNPGHLNPNSVRRTGKADPSVTVLSLQTTGGKPLALLANYGTHYAGAPALSADYFAVFASEIGRLLGADKSNPAFVAMMTNGTSGDTNCIDFVHKPRKYDRFTVGRDVAKAAFEACKTISYHDWVPVRMAERKLTLRIRKPSKDEVAEAKAYIRENKIDIPKTVEQVYAFETLVLSEEPPTRELRLQAIRIGGLGIGAMPNEVYSETGRAIKTASPTKTTCCIELANGFSGYLPPPAQHKLGGYTTWRARSSCLEEQAEPKIRETILALLKEVAAEK